MTFSKSLYAAVLLALALAAARAQTPRPGRDARAPASDPPAVSLKPSASRVVFASDCYENRPPEPACKATSALVRFNAAATNVGDAPVYTYTTNGGEIKGDGPNATLDLTGVAPGTYTVTVEVDAGRGPFASDSATVTAERCNCPLPPPPPCPSVTVSCPDTPGPGGALTFTAHVSGGDTNATPKFNWTVSAGAIKSGQGASSITVDTGGARPGSWTAAVDVGGYDRSCVTSASCTIAVEPPITPRKFDEYGDLRFDEEKARLDGFAAELRNDPSAQGYLICYDGRRGGASAARRRCDRAAKRLRDSLRDANPSRVVAVAGGCREAPTVESWVAPAGSAPAQATPTCPPGRPRPSPPARQGRARQRRG